MEVKSLPTQEVRAIGLKLAGCERSFFAASFPINLMAASFQPFGITDCDQKIFRSAGTSDRHFLRMMYGIWLKGDGNEECLDLLVTVMISHSLIGPCIF